MMSIKILLVDDHHVVRHGLALLLNSEASFEVIGEATNGLEAVRLAQELSPDIIVMDLIMPIMNGIQATEQILASAPDMRILILTSFSDQEYAIPVLEAGAAGYLLKENNPEELIDGINKIISGEKQIHPKITDELLAAIQQSRKPTQFSHDALTKRELQVLKEITNGKSNKEIASTLFITEKTVKTHVSNILCKLELQDRTQAAMYAVRNQLI